MIMNDQNSTLGLLSVSSIVKFLSELPEASSYAIRK